ncbi:type-F conjugative transfer system protein TraW [Massilia sp. TS11]|uniref:type-F conjugative transfer system protein TraW n=1 Tax=Massilia sp. TS11 TaxID=2908003 RepID=UPI001EDA516F|nr:type-F conjugative transfer system protein TraW [Massilia sp. TS11]MCG2583884.1 type-F conjugative transfer system protein TraW [Massilia sp. TS11]
MYRLIFLFCCLVVRTVAAQDVGALGPVYPITEQSFLDQIRTRLQAQERSGELRALQQRITEANTAAVTAPRPVPGLTTGRTGRTHYYDPSFTLDRNVVDAEGHLLFAAGTRKNPLDVVGFSRRLLFLDARDPAQLRRAATLVAEQPGKTKLVLLGGSYLQLMKSWKMPVYFDQHGLLVKRFGIAQVPALVYQEGRRLRVDELGETP